MTMLRPIAADEGQGCGAPLKIGDEGACGVCARDQTWQREREYEGWGVGDGLGWGQFRSRFSK